MSSNNNNKVISEAKPHTIKKFELIERYVEGWMHKLLNYEKCQKLIFIDCMCNSGEYYDENCNSVYGTAICVAKKLNEASQKYPNKDIHIFLNDIDSPKIEHLKEILPDGSNNFKLHVSCEDANDLLRKPGSQLMWLNDRLASLQRLHELKKKTWISMEPYPTPNLIEQDLTQNLNAVSFTDKIIFGRTNYCKEFIAYKTNKDFYNEKAMEVINFCKEHNINYRIKEKAITV